MIHPALKGLSPHEQRKQIRRWRYHRQYQRRRLGNGWELQWLFDRGVL
jgi:hypothetical protein